MILTKVFQREYCRREKRFLSAEFFSNNKHITGSRITSYSTLLSGVDHLTFVGRRGEGSCACTLVPKEKIMHTTSTERKRPQKNVCFLRNV